MPENIKTNITNNNFFRKSLKKFKIDKSYFWPLSLYFSCDIFEFLKKYGYFKKFKNFSKSFISNNVYTTKSLKSEKIKVKRLNEAFS